MDIHEVGVSFDIHHRTLCFYAFASKNRLVYTDKNIFTITTFLMRLGEKVEYHFPQNSRPIKHFISKARSLGLVTLGGNPIIRSGDDMEIKILWNEMWDEMIKLKSNR